MCVTVTGTKAYAEDQLLTILTQITNYGLEAVGHVTPDPDGCSHQISVLPAIDPTLA
jgi:hypothetical protein